jgi:hypothetical protein
MRSPVMQRAAVTRCVVITLGTLGCRALQSTTLGQGGEVVPEGEPNVQPVITATVASVSGSAAHRTRPGSWTMCSHAAPLTMPRSAQCRLG